MLAPATAGLQDTRASRRRAPAKRDFSPVPGGLTDPGAVPILNRGRTSAARGPGDEQVIGRWTARGTLAVLLLLLAAGPAVSAGAEEGSETGVTLRLVVRHALDAGRLVVRIGGAAFFSAPITSLGAASAGDVERLLSIPAGWQTVSVELRDQRGRVVAKREVHGLLAPGSAAVLDVTARTEEQLGLELRTVP